MSFIIFSTRMSLFITILAYVLYGRNITAQKVFMLTAYYNILRQTMTVYFPQGKYNRINEHRLKVTDDLITSSIFQV